jgi:IS5 family transposase
MSRRYNASAKEGRLRYEFGQKVGFGITNRSNWIVGVQMFPGNPYDGHTLASSIRAVEKTTRVQVLDAFVDKGYRGHDYQGQATVHISGSSNRDVSPAMVRRRRRRGAIEPKIGHMKSENRLGRCYLAGLVRDQINAVLAAAGSNFLKLLRAIEPALKKSLVYRLLMAIWVVLSTKNEHRIA